LRSLLQSFEIRIEKIKKAEQEKILAASDAYELGTIKELKIEYQEARKYYKQAANFDPDNSLYLNQYGSILHDLGEYNKAIEYFEKALDSDLKTYGEQHPQVAIYWSNLGLAWSSLGEYKKAIEYFEKALDSDLKTYGEQHPDVALRWNNLGSAWDFLGEYKKAIEYYEKALAVFEKVLGVDHPNTKIVKNNLDSVKK